VAAPRHHDTPTSETLTRNANRSKVTIYSCSTSQRYAELIGSDLALTVDQAGQADLTLANTHGDVVTTVDLPSGSAVAADIDGWNNYDEYGNAGTATADTGIVDYPWLGGKQRAVSGAGLTLMGVRLYNPVTALFSSTDPVPGGNANDYTYPSDPINSFDVDGKRHNDDDPKYTPRRLRTVAFYAKREARLRALGQYNLKNAKNIKASHKPLHLKRKWRKFRHWGMRRIKGYHYYGLRGGGSGLLLGATAGCIIGGTVTGGVGCGPGALALGGHLGAYGAITGGLYGLWHGSDKWY
jgi:RHS repeat-associated protein